MKKLIQGVATNDSDTPIRKTKSINGKQVIIWRCPVYDMWIHMIERCYSSGTHRKSYDGCDVSSDWLLFSNFRNWIAGRDIKGLHLDKDILNDGNRTYSSENCCLVPHIVNSFILDNKRIRGKYPLGVTFNKKGGRIQAQCKNPITKKHEWLGYFDNPEDAHEAWRVRKLELAIELANSELVTDDRVKKALIARYQGEK